MKYGGVYEAKVSGFGPNDEVLVLIPQVFGSAQVPVAAVLGDPPSANDKGVVAFISGEPEYPVWVGDGATSLQGIGAALESTQISVESAQAAADAAQSAADAAQADADTANIVANAAGSAASTAQSGVNALESNRLLLDGSNSPMTGQLSLVVDPTADAHAARKAYVDTEIAAAVAAATPTHYGGVHLRRNTSQGPFSFATAGATAIQWEEAAFDDSSFWSSSPNPENIVVPATGRYMISATVAFANDQDVTRLHDTRGALIYVDGTSAWTSSLVAAGDPRYHASNSSGGTVGGSNLNRASPSVSAILSLTVDQVITIKAYHYDNTQQKTVSGADVSVYWLPGPTS